MSGFGEQPGMEGEEGAKAAAASVSLGEPVFTEDGRRLGEIRGVEQGGFFVSTRKGVERLNVQHARSGHHFGEAEIMWRCTECGEMGEISGGLPDRCPNCDTQKEHLEYWIED